MRSIPRLNRRLNRRAAFQRGQWSLIGLLVSLAIIAILSAWYYDRILKPKAGSHNGAPASEQAAYGSACSEYQSQLNQAVMMYKGEHNDRSPTSFEQLKPYGATDDITHATGCQFQLDASTGAVTDIGRGEAAPNAQPVVVNAPPAAPSAVTLSAPVPPSPPGTSPVVAAPTRGPGGLNLPPNSSSVPANTGGDAGSE